jgi:hypothetical protein
MDVPYNRTVSLDDILPQREIDHILWQSNN